MINQNTRPTGEFVIDVQGMCAAMGRFGFRPANAMEIPAAVEMTERLLGFEIADSQIIERLHIRTRISAWVSGDPVDGFFAIMPLSHEGDSAVRNGSFKPSNPIDEHIAAVGDYCYAVYVGVYAGVSKETRRNIMQASATVRAEFYGSVACFARAATGDGARTMQSLGFGPIEGGLPDLWVQEALVQNLESAA